MTFLLFFVPGAIAVAGSLAYYLLRDRLITKLLKAISISFYFLGGLYWFVLATSALDDFTTDIFNASIDINYKLLICIPIYVIIATFFWKLSKKFDIHDEDNDEKRNNMNEWKSTFIDAWQGNHICCII